MKPFPGRYTVHRGFSTAVATTFADASLDFVYLDAQHNYFDVMNDLLVWWPKVGGLWDAAGAVCVWGGVGWGMQCRGGMAIAAQPRARARLPIFLPFATHL